jgi:hypothetical protein
MKKRIIIIIAQAILWLPLFAQESGKKLIPALIGIDLNYSYGTPMGDLATLYGNNLSVGTAIVYSSSNNKWSFGVSGNYLFGNKVKPDVIAAFRSTHEGLIIGSDNLLAEAKLKERGYYTSVWLGRLIPMVRTNTLIHGIKIKLGIGHLDHKIKIVDETRSINQWYTEYLKGFDHRAAGPAITTFIGYEFLEYRGRIWCYAGVEPIFGLTKSLRSYYYDLNQVSPSAQRRDFLMNFKIAWILPMYRFKKSDQIEY